MGFIHTVFSLPAAMGFRRFDEMVGQTSMLDKAAAISHWKAKGLDFTRLFHHEAETPESVGIYRSEPQKHPIDDVLDRKLIAQAMGAITLTT